MGISNISQRKTNQTKIVTPTTDRIPDNYFAALPLSVGVLFGFIGSLIIMATIAILTLSTGEDIWRSPRIIASAILGESAGIGIFPVILGTMIHLLSGSIYGAIFARITPRIPRPFWLVVGLMYGVAIWIVAVIVLPFLIQTFGVSSSTYFIVLMISHLIFGLYLGAAGTFYGLLASKSK